MDHRDPPPRRDLKPRSPKWNSPFWYLPLMLLLLWVWQSTLSQFSYKTIPYSEFKEHLHRKEVVRCIVREDEIQGQIKPQSPAEALGAVSTNTASVTNVVSKPAETP